MGSNISLMANSLKRKGFGFRGNINHGNVTSSKTGGGSGQLQALVMKIFLTSSLDILDFCPDITNSFSFSAEDEKWTECKGLCHGRPFSSFVKGLRDYAVIYVGAEEYLLPLGTYQRFDWG